jgi:hypothetical protein
VLAGIRPWLERSSATVFGTYAVATAFTAYFCMYAFRKPFTAATWDGESVGELPLKLALVISQLLGYALAKFLGIKFVSEARPTQRAAALLALIGLAELTLLLLPFVPNPVRVGALFINGLALGSVWGLVFGFLEGRRTTEILGAGLSTSYIVASGAVKSVGAWLLTLGVSDAWMPALTGLIFTVPFVTAVALLRELPPPTADDVAARTARAPMTGPERRAFVRQFFVGVAALTSLYVVLTAYRDVRDNFAADIWADLGLGGAPRLFTLTELPVAVLVLAALASVYRIADNRRALLVIHLLMLAGAAGIGLATLAFDAGLIGPVAWMIAVGVGLYLAYVPYGCVLFDRLIAATGVVGTAVFMIFVTDAFGYAGSVGLVLYKNFGRADVNWLEFFRALSYATSVVCVLAFSVSAAYFHRRTGALAR